MGWSERGKKGIHTGRTLRESGYSTGRWGRWSTKGFSEGLLVKYQANTANIPNSDLHSLLEDRYGLTDGLDLKFVPHIQSDGVVFSLGKRKRWLLPDLVRERVDEDVVVEEQDEKELHLCFQTRYSHEHIKRTKGDCVWVYSDHDGERKPKHKYSFYSDIKDKDSKPPEVGYEINQSPPSTCWPNFSQEKQSSFDYSYRPNGKKAKCKGKGLKNKGYRWGLCEDDMCVEEYTKKRHNDSKIKTVTSSEFVFAGKDEDSAGKGAEHFFRLDDFVKERRKRNAQQVKIGKSEVDSSGFTKYGKGSAVYIDTDAMRPQTVTPQTSNIKSWKEHQKNSVNIDIDAAELKVSNLQAEWGESYSEAAVSPRKFGINISSLLPSNKLSRIANVVFEEQDNTACKDIKQINTAVKLVYALIDGKSELQQAAKDFASYITRINGANRTWQVRQVVEAAVQCINVLTGESPEQLPQLQKPQRRKPQSVLNLNFLNELCECQSNAFTPKEAHQQIQEKMENEAKSTKRCDMTESQWTMLSVECGVCYEQFEENDNQVTSLVECGHSFCNECWVGHLQTQVTQGMDQLKCPGYDCDCKVDNITVMCLVPEVYEKFLNMTINRQLEKSPEWKWCPAKHCQNIVKATAESTDAFTVLCSCQHAWCFKCKKQSHWPASCAESEKFIQKSGDLNNLLAMESEATIRSVLVKNCPQCEYPIEKFMGCQFMWCVLCNVHFCWNCLAITSYGHTCERKPSDNITEVVLNVRNKRYEIQKYLEFILKSTQARKPKLLAGKRKKVRALERGLASHCEVRSLTVIPEGEANNSQVTKLMEDFVQNSVPENVQEAVEFEFQAHLALEGFAQKAAMSKTRVGKTALCKMSQLAFIAQRIDNMLQEPILLCKDEKMAWLKRLVELGKDCVVTLKESSSRSQH